MGELGVRRGGLPGLVRPSSSEINKTECQYKVCIIHQQRSLQI